MSFLNPVNEPVLRFSSTDASAPQINHNARVAGDVKTVLKACLVTGYGAKASAGWTAVNETATVAEFLSPDASMNLLRIGIDDTASTGNTLFYSVINDIKNTSISYVPKAFSSSLKTSPLNGWEMFVTPKGLFFVDLIYNSDVQKAMARVTYWGLLKSALKSDVGTNLMHYNVGWNGDLADPKDIFTGNYREQKRIIASDLTEFDFVSTIGDLVKNQGDTRGLAATDVVCPLYIRSRDIFVGQHPGVLLSYSNDEATMYGSRDSTVDGRPVFIASAAGASSAGTYAIKRSLLNFMIYLDYWEY